MPTRREQLEAAVGPDLAAEMIAGLREARKRAQAPAPPVRQAVPAERGGVLEEFLTPRERGWASMLTARGFDPGDERDTRRARLRGFPDYSRGGDFDFGR